MDSFYARDVQALFGLRNRTGFMALLKLAALRNGGMFDIADRAKESGMSRPFVMAHLDAMRIARAIFRVPPFHGGGHREIVRRPRAYVFDTSEQMGPFHELEFPRIPPYPFAGGVFFC